MVAAPILLLDLLEGEVALDEVLIDFDDLRVAADLAEPAHSSSNRCLTARYIKVVVSVKNNGMKFSSPRRGHSPQPRSSALLS